MHLENGKGEGKGVLILCDLCVMCAVKNCLYRKGDVSVNIKIVGCDIFNFTW